MFSIGECIVSSNFARMFSIGECIVSSNFARMFSIGECIVSSNLQECLLLLNVLFLQIYKNVFYW